MAARETERPEPPWGRIARDIHASGRQLVLSVTGGGSGAIGRLLQTPGASRSVLEAIVPYSTTSLAEWLGGMPEQACSATTARAMAMGAFLRARKLAPVADPDALVGVGCTASLATDRAKRGAHRVHVAVQTSRCTRSQCFLPILDGENRALQEEHAAGFVLWELAEACGVEASAIKEWLPLGAQGDALEGLQIELAQPARTDLLLGKRALAVVAPNSSVDHVEQVDAGAGLLVFPGAFNPPHMGHLRMAAIAEKRLGRTLTWELSIVNVDKPPLDFIAIRTRVQAIRFEDHNRAIALTTAPTFREKAKLFPGATFVVGVDTVLRVGDSRYYGEPTARDRALAEIAGAGCRFLVFGRQSAAGFQTLGDLDLTAGLRSICDEVPASEFREDVSSTQLRTPRGV